MAQPSFGRPRPRPPIQVVLGCAWAAALNIWVGVGGRRGINIKILQLSTIYIEICIVSLKYAKWVGMGELE